ncbi:MAG: hypothetical protein IKQ27_07790 [Lachnospiraceae bacterium]|nr:hypothetical protein [Lachnospiraceae bacterium]
MKLHFPKLYRYDRRMEHCYIAIPFAKGAFTEEDRIAVLEDDVQMPVQSKVTARYEDGSVRYLFVRFLADLPANKKKDLQAEVLKKGAECVSPEREYAALTVRRNDSRITVDGGEGGLKFTVADNAEHVFESLSDGRKEYTAEQFAGPYLKDGNGRYYVPALTEWRVIEEGPLVAVLRCNGICMPEERGTGSPGLRPGAELPEELPGFELKLTAYAGKPWVEVSYRLINETSDPLHVASLVFALKKENNSPGAEDLISSLAEDRRTVPLSAKEKGDSVGEGSLAAGANPTEGPLYETTGIKYLPEIEKRLDLRKGRTCVGSSNYKTNFRIGDGIAVERVVDAKYLVGEANEHFAEVFYGTFFTDYTDENGGVCATIFQAQQNYPKAVKADSNGIYVMLVPEDADRVEMQSGMSREQRFLLHFHDAQESLTEIDNRSLIYQMPDRAWIDPEVFKAAGVMPDIFVDRDRINDEVEIGLIAKADAHGRSYGMLNFGDAPDMNYTKQGRGKGHLVWTNNEYDYPHACALLYARTGERRFLDYMIAAGSHWMDVDVCHYSKDPLLLGGQWEHTRGHCVDGCMVCSHEWVEGLLDYYHFTGDERALETAFGIGENVRRLLETPMYQVSGESNARETGWALRTLTALYIETNDPKWVEKGEWIVGHFKEWTEEYGEWIAPYTDNTAIRTGFMISVAVGSLMRYYRVFPSEELKDLIMGAVDDLLENCLLANGLFYYKELPSLNRLGNNTLLLEAMTVGYELTGDTKYLEAGRTTFWSNIRDVSGAALGDKRIVEDAVIVNGGPTKSFAQSCVPLSVYYKAIADAGML